MGRGDEILATGFARGARARGKRIAFGVPSIRKLVWSPWSDEIFRNNPNIATPGTERGADVEWNDYCKGHRIYNRLDKANDRWVWNYDFRPPVGEFFLDVFENKFAASVGDNFIVIEPNVPRFKSVAPNKDWGAANYQYVANRLLKAEYDVVQFSYGAPLLRNVRVIKPPSFRSAVATLARAALLITPESGLHHAAAAVGTRAVVIFGGFIPPQVTGYDMHVNITGGAEACGSLSPCDHCRRAMMNITVDEVHNAVLGQLERQGNRQERASGALSQAQ